MIKQKGPLEKELKEVIRSLPKREEIVRGTLMKYYLTCGNKGAGVIGERNMALTGI